jgi:hypothetical protein
MSKNSLPPLLRGIGSTVLLTGAVIGFLAARHDMQAQQAQARSHTQSAPEENFADDVLENRSFEWLGLAGAAILTSSFYTEAYLRRKEGI